MNIARWFRWLPVAFGKKAPVTLAEQMREAFGNRQTSPRQTQKANLKKLRTSRLRESRRKAGAA